MLILLEDIQSMLKYYPNVDEENVMSLITLDPTYKKGSNNAGTYGKWILSIANKNNGDITRKRHITDVLSKFEEVKNQLKSKDIMKFTSVEALEDYLSDESNYKTYTNRQIQRKTQQHIKQGLEESEAEKVFEDAKWEVWIPKTFAASCKLGECTSWCTAMSKDSSYFNQYSSDGPLYIIINKSNPKEKYQFHFESDQFMDKKDYSIDIYGFLKENEGLYNFFMPMLKKTYNINSDGLYEATVSLIDISDEIVSGIKDNILNEYSIINDYGRSIIFGCIKEDFDGVKSDILSISDHDLEMMNQELYEISSDINDMLIEITGIDFEENTDYDIYDRYSKCVTKSIREAFEKIFPFKRVYDYTNSYFFDVVDNISEKYEIDRYLIKLFCSLESIIDIQTNYVGYDRDTHIIDAISHEVAIRLYPYFNDWSYKIDDYNNGISVFEEILKNNLTAEYKQSESLLTEDIDSMKQYYQNIPDDRFQYFIELDPTYKKGSTNAGTYGKWILTLANRTNGVIENEGHVTDVLKEFEDVKNRLKSKDIMRFKSVNELQNYLDDTDNYTELSDRQKLRQIQKTVRNTDLDKEAEIVYKDEDWTIWTPKTYEASCKLGENTSWCTAYKENRDWYDRYTAKGNLYIFINNDDPTEKYQLHLESDSFMDADDNREDLFEFVLKYPKLMEDFEPISDSIGPIKNGKLEASIPFSIFDTIYADGKQIIDEDIYSIIENDWFSDIKYELDIIEEFPYLIYDISRDDAKALDEKLSQYGYTIDTLLGLDSIYDVTNNEVKTALQDAADTMEKISIADYLIYIANNFWENYEIIHDTTLSKLYTEITDYGIDIDVPMDKLFDEIDHDDLDYSRIGDSILNTIIDIIATNFKDRVEDEMRNSGINSDYNNDIFITELIDNL